MDAHRNWTRRIPPSPKAISTSPSISLSSPTYTSAAKTFTLGDHPFSPILCGSRIAVRGRVEVRFGEDCHLCLLISVVLISGSRLSLVAGDAKPEIFLTITPHPLSRTKTLHLPHYPPFPACICTYQFFLSSYSVLGSRIANPRRSLKLFLRLASDPPRTSSVATRRICNGFTTPTPVRLNGCTRKLSPCPTTIMLRLGLLQHVNSHGSSRPHPRDLVWSLSHESCFE